MKYLSIAQTAERWGISTRRIQILCCLLYTSDAADDIVRRGACPRCYPHWHGLGDSRGRREAGGRENQERQVYQEARRKRKMSRRLYQRL